MSSATDEAIFDFAREHARICVTLDQDFHRILAGRQAIFPSVILLRFQKLRAPEVTKLILKVLDQAGERLLSGLALTASKNGIRIRKLPLR